MRCGIAAGGEIGALVGIVIAVEVDECINISIDEIVFAPPFYLVFLRQEFRVAVDETRLVLLPVDAVVGEHLGVEKHRKQQRLGKRAWRRRRRGRT